MAALTANSKVSFHAAEYRGFELRHHLVGVGDEIGREITAVKLHAFNDLEFKLERLESSTIITPSLPTFCMASAIFSPISLSPLAAIVPT